MTFAASLSRIPAPRRQRRNVLPMNLGLYLDRPFVSIPEGGLTDCLNVRLKEGKVINGQMGYEHFMDQQLDGRVILIDQFFLTNGNVVLLFGTPTTLYRYSESTEKVTFINPTYEAGTVSAISAYDSGNDETTITGTTTQWDTAAAAIRPGDGQGPTGNNAKVGDYIAFLASENDPDENWYRIKAINSDTELVVEGDASAESTGAYTIRQSFELGQTDDVWFPETFPNMQPAGEDRWYATNGKDIVTWDGSDFSVTVLDLGFQCKVLLRHKNMMLYGNLLESGASKGATVRNSAIAEPENVTTKEAAEVVTTDGIDDLSTLVPIGDVMAAYHDRSINIMQFVGLPLVWVIRTAIPGLGPISPRAIMDFGDFHEFVGSDTGYNFDGVGVQESGGQVFREVLRTIDASRRLQFLTHIDEENGDVLWIPPLSTDEGDTPELAYTEHYLENVGRAPTPFAIREIPATETGFFERAGTLTFADLTDIWTAYNFKWNDRFLQASFPENLFGDANGNIFRMNTAEYQDTRAVGAESFTKQDIVSFARSHRFPAIDGRSKGMAKRIEVFAERRGSATYDLTVIVRAAKQLEGPITGSVQRAYDLTQAGNRFVNPRLAGRFFEVEFATTGQAQPWEVAGFAYEGQEMGER